MKKSRISKNACIQTDRILFFDIMRIAFVALIVYGHSQFDFLSWLNKILYIDGYTPLNIYPVGLAPLSVYGLIFVSGAVIEYHYKGIEHFSEYIKFLFKRCIRLYPAFWMSLIFGILLFPIVLKAGIFDVFFEFTGFYVILGKGPGNINIMGWFIAAIMSLYLLFPFISKIVKKYQFYSIVVFLLISFSCRFFLLTYNVVPLEFFFRWFPLCNLFEFGLGIYIVQNKLYPQNMTNHPTIHQLSDLSYYVFLFHWIVLCIFSYTVNNFQLFYICEILGLNFPNMLAYLCDYCFMMATILIVSWVAMALDKKIQQRILSLDAVRNYLKS
jgi:peptidoglycan/LPS O-acetylase OafA/YrhL